MLITFYLARHGETQWNKRGLLQGQLDSPLTSVGKAQAIALGQALSDKHILRIYSSSLGRARQTSILCNNSLKTDIVLNTGLMERNFGAWQGRSVSVYDNATKQAIAVNEKDSDDLLAGETQYQCAKRLENTLVDIGREVSEQYQDNAINILVISHGEVIRHFINTLTDTPETVELLSNGRWQALTFNQNQRFSIGY